MTLPFAVVAMDFFAADSILAFFRWEELDLSDFDNNLSLLRDFAFGVESFP